MITAWLRRLAVAFGQLSPQPGRGLDDPEESPHAGVEAHPILKPARVTFQPRENRSKVGFTTQRANGPVDGIVKHHRCARLACALMPRRYPPVLLLVPEDANLLIAKLGLVVALPPFDPLYDRRRHAAHSGYAILGIGEQHGEQFAAATQLVAPFRDALLHLVALPEIVDEALQWRILAAQRDPISHDVGRDHPNQPPRQRILPPGLAGVEHLLVEFAPALVGHALGIGDGGEAVVAASRRHECYGSQPRGESLQDCQMV